MGSCLGPCPPDICASARTRSRRNPDLRVRAAIDLVFRKFDEMQSVRQVHLWFSDEGLELPSRPTSEKEQLRWQVPNYARVREILTNPVYCGAYAYGRTAIEVTIHNGQKKVRRKVVSNRDDWQVFIPDNHEGYISLETWERNQRVIADNSVKMMPSGSRGAVRSGAALLTGLLRCGHCGRKLTVSYSGVQGTRAAVHLQFGGHQSQRAEVHLVRRPCRGRGGRQGDGPHSRAHWSGGGAPCDRGGCRDRIRSGSPA